MPTIRYRLPPTDLRIPDRLLERLNVERANRRLATILSGEIQFFGPDGVERTESRQPLGEMALGALARYLADPGGFGATAGSIDAHLKPFFSERLSSSRRRAVAADIAARYRDWLTRQRDVDASGATMRLRTPVFDGVARAEFIARKSQDRLADIAFQELAAAGALPPGLVTAATREPPEIIYRRITSTLLDIRCNDAEELEGFPSTNPGDEIFVITTAAVYDASGALKITEAVSDLAEGIQSGDSVPLAPPGFARMLEHSVLNGPDSSARLPLSVAVSVALVEQEYSSADQIRAAVQGAVSVAKLIASAASGNVIGAVLALKDVLIALATLLDGDDALGSTTYVCPDVLMGPNRNSLLAGVIKGSNNANAYEYVVSFDFITEDIPGQAPTLSIRGPHNISTQREVVRASFELVCPNATLREIVWSVTPAGATVHGQGQRRTSVSFLAGRSEAGGRNYVVSVQAVADQYGRLAPATHAVTCSLDVTTPDPGPNRRIP